MANSTLELMDAIIGALKADAGVTAIVGTRVYAKAPQNPAYPLIEFGSIIGVPFEGQAMDGWQSLVAIEHWSRDASPVQVEESMAAAYVALHDVPISLATQVYGYGRLISQDTILQDDDATRLGRQRWEFVTTD